MCCCRAIIYSEPNSRPTKDTFLGSHHGLAAQLKGPEVQRRGYPVGATIVGRVIHRRLLGDELLEAKIPTELVAPRYRPDPADSSSILSVRSSAASAGPGRSACRARTCWQTRSTSVPSRSNRKTAGFMESTPTTRFLGLGPRCRTLIAGNSAISPGGVPDYPATPAYDTIVVLVTGSVTLRWDWIGQAGARWD
jgi:hypothetical protein